MIAALQQVGNYRIEREIGRGATSEVWLAHHLTLEQRKVAVKFLLSQEPETVERFNREAMVMSTLHHPNIVAVYDHGYAIPYYYTVIEFIQGCALQSLIERVGRLDILDALNIFRQIASALDYAHANHIVHRDISPGNILVEEETGRALLSDFGIARDLRRNITVDSRVMGTPGFWSPEHTRSATEVTALSDIFGLGVVLYVMLSGNMPWDEIPVLPGQSFPPPIPLIRRGITNLPSDVDRILQTMMAVDPAKRYVKAQMAVEELERVTKRHHAATVMLTTGATAQHRDHGTFPCDLGQEEQNPVEIVLGPDLIRAPIAQASERAQAMSDPATISHLLNTWATQGFSRGFFRQAQLGRLARLHEICSRNVCFYHLQVLYEHRGEPQEVEEPDCEAKEFPLEPEVDRWAIPLPQFTSFAHDEGGEVDVPGSTQVVRCDTCEGKGKVVCPRCKGKGRVLEVRMGVSSTPPTQQGADEEDRTVNRTVNGVRFSRLRRNAQQRQPSEPRQPNGPAISQPRREHVLVPCPECEGRGGTPCQRCAGTGRLVKHQMLRWRRTSLTFTGNDSLAFVRDEAWLRRSCTIHEIYRERVIGDPKLNTPAFHPEWSRIPVVQSLIAQAMAEVPDRMQARIVLSELSIGMIPITEIVFDLGKPEEPGGLYQVAICGFENAIPPDWRLLDWERVTFFWSSIFLLVVSLILGFFAFSPC